jgi:hypothetical protein
MYVYINININIYICMCVCNRKGKYMKHSTSKVMELEPHLVGDVFFGGSRVESPTVEGSDAHNSFLSLGDSPPVDGCKYGC